MDFVRQASSAFGLLLHRLRVALTRTFIVPPHVFPYEFQDLDEAMPAYYAAIKALDSLDKKSIQEMKSFTNPPQVI